MSQKADKTRSHGATPGMNNPAIPAVERYSEDAMAMGTSI